MTTSDYTVGQYLVDRLSELGLDHLFAIPGDYCADWVHEYVEPSTIERISPTNELNAGYAADGYARLKGIGAVCVTYSVGAFSLFNAIAGSFTELVPVVAIVGAPSRSKWIQYRQEGLQYHHIINGHGTNLNVYRNVTCAAERVEDGGLAPGQIDAALRACITHRQPVYLEMAEDVYNQPCSRPVGTLTPAALQSDAAALQAAVQDTMALLKAAKKPLLWAGVEIERYGLRESFTKLLNLLDIPYVTSYMGKAVIGEDNPNYLGVYEGKCTLPGVLDIVEECDFFLTIGTWYTDINSLGLINLPWEKMSFAGHRAVRLGTNLHPNIGLEAYLDALLAAAQEYASPGCWAQRPTRILETTKPDAPITYQGFYDFTAPSINADSIILGGTGFNLWGSVLIDLCQPDSFLSQSAYTDIGYVTPAAVGASFAGTGQKVVVFAGDGGFQMTAQCLSSMARYGQETIIYLVNNNVYGIEQWLADPAVFGNDDPFLPLAEIARWNYSELPHAFGDTGRGWKVTTYAELAKATEEALQHKGGPALIQVVVEPKSIPTLAAWKVPGAS